jgi:uncharacterized repeat protein (TIGR01451 family)
MKKILSLKTLFAPLGLAAALAMGPASAAWAANATEAGTVVENTITLSYDGADNGSGPARIDLPTASRPIETFKVARKIDLTLVADQSGQQLLVNPAQTAATIAFTLTNLGNPNEGGAAQGFNITVAATGTIGDGSTALTYSATQTTDLGKYYVTVGGTVTDVNTVATDVSLASNGTSTIQIIANIPSGATDGLADVFTVTAVAVDSGTAVSQSRSADLDVVSVVWADAASTSTMTGGTPALDPAVNGQAKAETRMLVSAPKLSATKTAVVLDEGLPGSSFVCATGGTATGSPLAPIPGACVEYTITVTNASDATAAATNITITDVLQSDTTYAGVTQGDFTSVTESGGTVTATLVSLAIDASASFKVRVTVK